MIDNYICKNCDRLVVCKVNDKIAPFEEGKKADLGVKITLNTCENYKEVQED